MELLTELEWTYVYFFGGKHLGVELLDCLVIVCLTFVEVALPFYVPTSIDESSSYSISSPTLDMISLFLKNLAILRMYVNIAWQFSFVLS